MFKICVIGCGYMAMNGHGYAFMKYKNDYADVSLSACCDIDEEKAVKFKEKFGFENYYNDYEKMLEEINPDVVSLICPVQFTKALSVDIIKKGYNIILEKPPGLNTEEIAEMISASKENDVFIRTAFNRRYAPLIVKLKEMIKGQRILNITYQMYRYNRRDNDFATTAIHAIDATKNITGSDYKKIEFTYQNMPDIGENVSNIYMNCEFENGVIGQISIVPMGGGISERITINTLDHTYYVELPFWNNMDAPGRLRAVTVNETVCDILGSELTDSPEMFEEMGFYEENRSFFELIRSGAPKQSDLESGLQSVDIANYIRNRKSVYLKEN